MDLEVVGRHALFFDDDAMAAFVNSGDALVEWHSLQIDRYDVRHLLSDPLPPRRLNSTFASPSPDEFLIDQERYIDLPPESDRPGVEKDEKPSGSDGYHFVAFSYGNTDDSSDQRSNDGGMGSSGYMPPFAIPENVVLSLPPTEKVHQIIARTAMFVSKHGGQSEIILRVKQGDNPTFGFLMPDHHLHAYFRYLVEHPELLHTEFDEKPHDEKKRAGDERKDNSNSVGGALSLLGSAYGSGEDEDGDDAVNPSPTHVTQKVEAVESAAKDEPTSRKPIVSNKENVPTVKKNSSIIASKPRSLKGIKKEGKSGLVSAAEEKSKINEIGAISNPPILEPPPEMKRLIDKLVEFVMRNGKQIEATLLEQDAKHERFSFLLPSDQYHAYYLRALQEAQESKVNGKNFPFGKDDPRARGTKKKASPNDLSHVPSDYSDVPFESDRKEKFKMVIGKSKKDGLNTEKGAEESGLMVDAAAAAAILQAATRGIKSSNSQNHLHRSEGGQSVGAADASDANLTEEQKRKAERLKKAKMFVSMLKSGAVPTKAGETSRGSSVDPLEPEVQKSAGEINVTNQEREGSIPPAEFHMAAATDYLSERQNEWPSKRKYRLKSVEGEDDQENKDEQLEDDHSRRKYRSRSRRDKDEENDKVRHGSHSSMDNESGESGQEDGDHKRTMQLPQHSRQETEFGGMHEEDENHQKRKYRSRSRRHEEQDDVGNAVEKERNHRRRRRRSRSSSEEDENEEDISESDREHKRYRPGHHSHYCGHGCEEERDKKCRKSHSKRRHRSKSRRREKENENSLEKGDKCNRKRDSPDSSDEEKDRGKSSGDDRDEYDGREDVYKKEKDRKRSRKSHHSSKRDKKRHRHHHSSHHSRDKHQHRSKHSSRERESRAHHKHDSSSSDDEVQHHARLDTHKKGPLGEREESEEGEINSKVSEGPGKRGASVDVTGSQQRASPQAPDSTEIPDDLRAKIRAMLMATRS